MRVKASSLEGRKAHAFLDGVDVSAECVEADDEQGWVELLVRNEKGRIRVGFGFGSGPLVRRHFGAVVIKL
jgi:hypothetical protein